MRYKGITSGHGTADGDKCMIVFTSPEAMMEFSGEKKFKLSLSARQKTLLTYVNL